MRKQTKVIITLASAIVLVLSFAGVAYAADDAVPGDALYGLDCALENAGIGDGGLEERLSEAGALIDEGEVDAGLNLAAQALTEEEDDDEDGDVDEDDGEIEDDSARREALLAAAEAVLANGSEQSLETRTRVAAKLTFMATTELTGREYGQAVSQLARGVFDEEQDSEESTSGKTKPNKGKANGHSK